MSFSLPTQGCSARVAGSLGRNEPAKRGIWRDTAEWGAAYSMVMTEAGVHDRMPAILPRSDWADWLDGAPDAAGLLCRPYELGMRVERTVEAWVRR